MSPTQFAFVVTWLFLGLLYLALARVLVDLRSMRLVAKDRSAPQVEPYLPPVFSEGDTLIALVVDTSCPFCDEILELATAELEPAGAAVLTFEDEARWTSRVPFPVVVDRESWASFAPLSAPIFARVDPIRGGLDVYAPLRLDDASRCLRSWNIRQDKAAAHE